MASRASLIAIASLVFFSTGDLRAYADTCRDNLVSEREGMIDIRTPMQAEAVTSREALQALGQGNDLSTALSFQRTIEDFWRRKVRKSVEPTDLEVRYKIIGGGERNGFAAHDRNDSLRFPIRLIPRNPRILCEDSEHRIISGGFTLLARASAIGLAGFYAVEIDVDVEER